MPPDFRNMVATGQVLNGIWNVQTFMLIVSMSSRHHRQHKTEHIYDRDPDLQRRHHHHRLIIVFIQGIVTTAAILTVAVNTFATDLITLSFS